MTKPLKIPEPEVTCRTMGKTHGMILPSSLSLLKHDMVTLTRGLDHPEDTCKRKPPDAESEQIFEGPNPFIDHKMEDTGRPPPLKWKSISRHEYQRWNSSPRMRGTHRHGCAELIATDARNSSPRMHGTHRHGCAELIATDARNSNAADLPDLDAVDSPDSDA